MDRCVMVVDGEEKYHELRITTGPDGHARSVCGTSGSASRVVSWTAVRETRPCRRCAVALGRA